MQRQSLSARRGLLIALMVPSLSVLISGCVEREAEAASTRRQVVANSATPLPPEPMTNAPGRPPCDFSVAGTNCPGLLASTTPTVAELNTAYSNALARGDGSYRKVFELCRPFEPCHYADTDVNMDMRGVDFAHLPTNRGIVVGDMRWSAEVAFDDRTYKVGSNLANTQMTRRTFFVMIPLDGKTPLDPGYGTITARWRLYGVQMNSDVPTLVDTGYVVKCKYPHPDAAVARSGFRGCLPLKRIHEEAARLGLSFQDVLNIDQCEPGLIRNSGIEFETACAKQRESKVAALRLKLKAQGKSIAPLSTLTALGDPTLDTYWFSCANGCCTADMPEQIRKAAR